MVGKLPVGGGAPVSVQSMTNTDTRNVARTLAQIKNLVKAGCEIVRVAVPDETAAHALPQIISGSSIPVIADIHFDARLALLAIEAGVHGLRLNPGNIGGPDKVRLVAEKAGEAGIPIRVGANAGSLPKGLLEDCMARCISREDAIAQALVESTLAQCRLLEECHFPAIKVSLKASDVSVTVSACRLIAARTDYPLHLGITEAGTLLRGSVKSAIGIGSLLLDGIGDTIRVSLTSDPVHELKVARLILEDVGLRSPCPEIVSCPTCGRTQVDLLGLAEKVERLVEELQASGALIKMRKIAVMGCVVNGPGEARDADIGLAGGKGVLMLFKKGEMVGTYSEREAFQLLREEILKASKE